MHDVEWNAALAAWFLRAQNADRPLYLWVDEETLEQVAREQDAECGDEPVADFERALRTHAPRSRLFRPWCVLLDRWDAGGREGIPPFLTALGATVLAASRRGLGKTGAGQASYYKELWKIFGRDGDRMPDGFADDVPRMWRAFNTWLVEDRHGAVGLPTAEPPQGYWPYIGWAVSQALLTGYDRSNLTRFFVAIGLEPGTELSVDEALLRFLHWERSGGAVSVRLKTALADANLQRRVGEVIVSQLSRWDGSERDQVGRRILPIVTTLDAGRGRCLGLAVLVPAGVTPQTLETPAGPIALDHREGFAVVQREVESIHLQHGFRWTLEGVTLEMRGRVVIPFLPDDRMNRWSSVDRVELGREHFVLAHTSVASTVGALLRLRAPAAKMTSRLKIPGGWVAYRGVVIENQNPRVPVGLEPLVPRPREIPGLTGGLRLVSGRRVYLADGPPDVVVPGIQGHPLRVRLDGQLVKEVSSDLEVIPLAGRGLASGDHVVEVESLRMAFSLLDRFQERATEATLGHRLRAGPSAWVVSGPPGELKGDADLEISGARLQGKPGTLPPGLGSTMVKAGASKYFAVTQDLQVVQLHPVQPDWAHAIGLPFNSFELDPELQAAQVAHGSIRWVVRLFTHKAELIEVGGEPIGAVTAAPESFRDLVRSLDTVNLEFSNAAPAKVDEWEQASKLARGESPL